MSNNTITNHIYSRLNTVEVKVGDISIGAQSTIKIQTMTTTDTMDTDATVSQAIRCIEAGSELIRVTTPSKKEAENLVNIKKKLYQKGYRIPIIADVHYTPNVAEIASRIVEKVRINPGNYTDKKKIAVKEYSNIEYQSEIDKVRSKFLPLIKICKQYGTAMRIGTNHGSLSDRIMSRYGDTPIGMVESALEFLRIAVDEGYKQIILSMKSSNPSVMVKAYRLLVEKMEQEFNFLFPLHLGVTEAGDGEDGRIKSAIGIGTLLEEGIGDTIRVSLTEDPEFEIPVCKNIVERYSNRINSFSGNSNNDIDFNNFQNINTTTTPVKNIGGNNVPVVIIDFSNKEDFTKEDLSDIGYIYDINNKKWDVSSTAADYIFLNEYKKIDLPHELKIILPYKQWDKNISNSYPILSIPEWVSRKSYSEELNFIDLKIDDVSLWGKNFELFKNNKNIVIIISSMSIYSCMFKKLWFIEKQKLGITIPVIIKQSSIEKQSICDKDIIHYAVEGGSSILDNFGNGLFLTTENKDYTIKFDGKKYLETKSIYQFLNNISFSILQATKTRISKTEYISCPSCGRTLFDLQEMTTKIKNATKHLKKVKIAVMGCIVNGPGEMADADFGYVGSGIGKVHLYKGKEIVKKNVDSDESVDELIKVIKENGFWND